MIYRTIPTTNLKISQIGLGTSRFGTLISPQICFDLLNTYVERGGNLIDTAKVYADWYSGEKSASEKTIGTWLKKRKKRDDLIISTKGGYPSLENMQSRLQKKDLKEDLDCSLQNLNTDYIDLYWLHRDDEKYPASYFIDILNEFTIDGKIKPEFRKYDSLKT